MVKRLAAVAAVAHGAVVRSPAYAALRRGILRIHCVQAKNGQSRFFAKARPEADFKYRSNSSARWRSVKAVTVLIRQGRNLIVCGTWPELCVFKRSRKSSVKPT